jgi:signal transduction histidine kinase
MPPGPPLAAGPRGSLYSRQGLAERQIAGGRVVLAAFSLLAIGLDPSNPAGHAKLTYHWLIAYTVYALFVALVVWHSRVCLVRLGFATHALDLAAFVVFMFFTRGPASPFFVYFAFSLLCATVRWRSRGTLWTAVAALTMYVGLGVYSAAISPDPAFELNQFIIRSVSLGVLAILLGYMGAHDERLHREISALAAWPHTVPQEARALRSGLLENAAAILNAPRMLMAWGDPEEDSLLLASWSRGEFRWTDEPPGTFLTLVAEPLAGTDFLCPDVCSQSPTVWHTAPGGLRRWQGMPIGSDLQARFAVDTVLSFVLRGESIQGRLFFLGKAGLTSDDLGLGGIVAREVAARMDYYYLLQRLRRAAVDEERIRLARELHDGVIQSLTATALQLQTVRHMLRADPQAAQERLEEIQRLIAEEQRDLRFFIQELKPAPLGLPEAGLGLAALLEELSRRVEDQWGLHVELKTEGLDERIFKELANGIYRIVREALVNAAKHAHASAVRVEVDVRDSLAHITVADNGRGFSFRGRYDHAALTELRLGPISLKERVASLGGSLIIDSTEAGARLEIGLPLRQPGSADGH